MLPIGFPPAILGFGGPKVSPLVRYHIGRGRDCAGRRHADVLALDDTNLEWWHDWVQWTFPLREGSEAVPTAPTLTDEDVAILRRSEIARERMEHAKQRMLAFLEGGKWWIRENDHNHYRITRTIRSLRIVLGDQAADDFRRSIFEMIMSRPHRVGRTALSHWRNA